MYIGSIIIRTIVIQLNPLLVHKIYRIAKPEKLGVHM